MPVCLSAGQAQPVSFQANPIFKTEQGKYLADSEYQQGTLYALYALLTLYILCSPC